MIDKTISGKYELTREIGRGAMGIVYEAHDTGLNRVVAIKALSARYTDDPAFIKRFQREARNMARLDHSNIIRVFDITEDGGAYYIVMEYFPGKNLHQLLREKGDFSRKESLSIALQVSKALSYAHLKGVIHRDIKPENIMVNDAGAVKLADFGIAAATGETTLTLAGQIIGTPKYMSPEQARAEVLDGGSDLYSLGMVLYEMLTGTSLFYGDSVEAILKDLRFDTKEFKLSFPRALNPPLQDLMRSLLRKKRAKRLSDAETLALRLSESLSEDERESRQARTVNSTTSPEKSFSALGPRQWGRTAAVLAAVLATVLVLIGGGAIWNQQGKNRLEPSPTERSPDLQEKGQDSGNGPMMLARAKKAEEEAAALRLKQEKAAEKARDERETLLVARAEKAEEEAAALRLKQEKARDEREALLVAQAKKTEEEAARRLKQEKEAEKARDEREALLVARAKKAEEEAADLRLKQEAAALRLKQKIEAAKAASRKKPGTVFREKLAIGGLGPEMVVIPSGRFQMGDLQDEGDADEKPVHRVVFQKPFAMGKYEVSVGEFRRFVRASGYKTDAEQGDGSVVQDEKTGKTEKKAGINWRLDFSGQKAAENRPVIHVSWNDAKAYVQWLARETKENYRLPSEAELEHANRAGSRSSYPWGEGSPQSKVANLVGELDRSSGGLAWTNNFKAYGDGFWGPAPLGSFAANAFGLHDTAGNVWEWAADCWHKTYKGAPANGRTWGKEDGGDCSRRVLRGGSWFSGPSYIRSAFRSGGRADYRGVNIGFRLSRTLK